MADVRLAPARVLSGGGSGTREQCSSPESQDPRAHWLLSTAPEEASAKTNSRANSCAGAARSPAHQSASGSPSRAGSFLQSSAGERKRRQSQRNDFAGSLRESSHQKRLRVSAATRRLKGNKRVAARQSTTGGKQSWLPAEEGRILA